jgi:mono/diheme cytochrome c family protein
MQSSKHSHTRQQGSTQQKTITVDSLQENTRGEEIYQAECYKCHLDGQGMPFIYPPLSQSDYLNKQPLDTIIHTVLYGVDHPIMVNGKEYKAQLMEPLSAHYSTEDMTHLINYVLRNFSGRKDSATFSDVMQVIQSSVKTPQDTSAK